MLYELLPIHDSRKSFYNKAHVSVNNYGESTLISYTTEVARINKEHKLERLWSGYSMTTQRHIKEFLLQNGFTMKDWENAERRYE